MKITLPCEVFLVPAKKLDQVWPHIEDKVTRACEEARNRETPETIKAALHEGRFQLWVVIRGQKVMAILLTEIAVYSLSKVCRLIVCIGEDYKAWVGLIKQVEDWAKDMGCSEMEPLPRPGWEKVLKPLGYRKTHVVLNKEL